MLNQDNKAIISKSQAQLQIQQQQPLHRITRSFNGLFYEAWVPKSRVQQSQQSFVERILCMTEGQFRSESENWFPFFTLKFIESYPIIERKNQNAQKTIKICFKRRFITAEQILSIVCYDIIGSSFENFRTDWELIQIYTQFVMGRKSLKWAFKHMIYSTRQIFLSTIPNYDMLKNIHHVKWKYLRVLNLSRSKIASLQILHWMDMPQVCEISLQTIQSGTAKSLGKCYFPKLKKIQICFENSTYWIDGEQVQRNCVQHNSLSRMKLQTEKRKCSFSSSLYLDCDINFAAKLQWPIFQMSGLSILQMHNSEAKIGLKPSYTVFKALRRRALINYQQDKKQFGLQISEGYGYYNNDEKINSYIEREFREVIIQSESEFQSNIESQFNSSQDESDMSQDSDNSMESDSESIIEAQRKSEKNNVISTENLNENIKEPTNNGGLESESDYQVKMQQQGKQMNQEN